MPIALEQLDLSDFDLVISNESGPAKGVITRSDALHICYCFSPMRYLWDMYPEYLKNSSFLIRLFMVPCFHYLRLWDVSTANRVDNFLTISHAVQARVKRWWKRDSEILYPPVDMDRLAATPDDGFVSPFGDEPYYIYLGALVPYKRADLAVKVCKTLGKNLLVIGNGSEIKKLKGKMLLDTFSKVRSVACNLHYCGTLSTEEAARQIKLHLPLEEVSIPSNSPYIRDLMTYDKPTVFFMDMEDVAQSIIYAYMYIDPLKAKEDRPVSRLFSAYFGGDMSSLMFQEIREFRSFAYQVNARLKHPPLNRSEKPASFVMKLATQTDKMIDAMEVLENLVHDMPERPERVESVKQTIRNWVNNEYPTSRSLSLKIAGFRREGYESDPNKDYLEVIDRMTMEDILRFYKENIQDHLMIYAIVGNSKSMDMEKLSKFGQIVKVTRKDIYK